MEKIQIRNIDSVYNKIECESGVARELQDYFSFFVPNYKFQPKFRAKLWDGKIRLFNLRNNTIYYGLNHQIENFCKERDYSVEYSSDFSTEEFSVAEAKKFISSLNLPVEMKVRDYQLKTFIRCIRNRRALVLSPTASGKSLIIYLLTRYYNLPTLIIVPTTSLIHQMEGDFESYGYKGYIHKIYSGQEKETPCKIKIQTQDGNQYIFDGNQSIKLINNEKKLAKNLGDKDEIDDRWLQEYKTKQIL